MASLSSRFSRRSLALFWLLLVSVVVGVLIYLEQIALLYVLATVSLVVLLGIVAFSPLEKVGTENLEGLGAQREGL